MTPHINAEKNDIAKTVLMPGDPLRAKFIAENFLSQPRLVNTVRNMFMYTGTYKGQEITVAGSGMGSPSIGIYSYELYKFYDVANIVRIGSAGSYVPEVKVYDIVNVTKAYGESLYGEIAAGIKDKVIDAPGNLTEIIRKVAQEHNIALHEGTVHSSEVFYRHNDEDWKDIAQQYQALCVEMESFALFTNATKLGKKAGCILTISDSFVTGEVTSSQEREKNFTRMMNLALESAINF